MDFLEYMRNLRNERDETVKAIEKLTRSSHSTVYQWTTGRKNVSPIKKKIIAEYLGIPENELFPINSKEKQDGQIQNKQR